MEEECTTFVFFSFSFLFFYINFLKGQKQGEDWKQLALSRLIGATGNYVKKQTSCAYISNLISMGDLSYSLLP